MRTASEYIQWPFESMPRPRSINGTAPLYHATSITLAPNAAVIDTLSGHVRHTYVYDYGLEALYEDLVSGGIWLRPSANHYRWRHILRKVRESLPAGTPEERAGLFARLARTERDRGGVVIRIGDGWYVRSARTRDKVAMTSDPSLAQRMNLFRAETFTEGIWLEKPVLLDAETMEEL
jgi:hypothetical protein